MPLLGLFSRTKKSRNVAEFSPTTTTTTEHDTLSNAPSSPTAEYIRPDKSLPSNPNGKNIYHNTIYPTTPSPNKLRVPFSRKPSATASASLSSVAIDNTTLNARPSLTSVTTASVEGHSPPRTRIPRSHLRPPPSKSAIFAAYGDPHSALSTRSLPPKTPSQLPPSPPSPPLPPIPTKRSLFNWTKQKSKTTPNLPAPSPPPTLPTPPPLTDNDTFNLKSFRHLSPPSPSDPLPLPIPAPLPRPRTDSLASDASQRISVAAFREAHSRRSIAGSPAPSFRSPSPGPLGSATHLPRSPVSRNAGSSPGSPKQGASPPATHARNDGRRSTVLSVASSAALTGGLETSEESEEGSEEESEEWGAGDGGGDSTITRQRTITKGNADLRGRVGSAAKAKSESGHGHSEWQQPRGRIHSSFDLLGSPTGAVRGHAQPPRSQSSLGVYGSARPRASVSTSVLVPGGAPAPERRPDAPALANISAPGPGAIPIPSPVSKHTHDPANKTHSSNHGSSASSSSTDSDDDAPLATLVGPKRPGSAFSSASSSHSHAHAHPKPQPRKPLIDISTLTTPPKPSAAPPSGPGFTPGATLLAGASAGPSKGAQPSKFTTPPPVKFVSPPTSDTSSDSEDPSAKSVSPRPAAQQKTPSPAVVKRGAAAAPKDPGPRRGVGSPAASRKSTASPPPVLGKSAGKEVSSVYFSERLTRVVQENVGREGALGDVGGGVREEQKGVGVGAAGERSSRVHHRRASSDQTIAWRDTVEGASAGVNADAGRPANTRTDSVKDEPWRNAAGETEKTEQIVPTPIRQRDPPSSFSVTSRPRQHPELFPPQQRPRSTTLLSAPTPSSILNGSGSGSGSGNGSGSRNSERPQNPRQRSTTMVPHSSLGAGGAQMPAKPFAERRESPASSTGGSSSGRMPLTPRDGSDVGGAKSEWGSRDSAWGSGVSGLAMAGGKGHAKKASAVSFEEESEVRGRERRIDEKGVAGQGENRRNERRRTEAKAAIELGNVINGPGPNLDDEDSEDDEIPVNQAMGARMGMMNPRMAGGSMPMGFGPPTGPPTWNAAWQQQQGAPMLSPAQFMIPPPADPNFFAAHQQAMMIAKQAYQMAVAQQALAAAGEEWERGSSVGGYGGAMSIYGGASPAAMPVPGLGMGGMGMGMGGGWPAGSMMLPQSVYGGGARSEYGGGARSEYGGGGGGAGGWGSKSVYGESFGPVGDRTRTRRGASQPRGESGYLAGANPPLPDKGGSGYATANAREGQGRARARTASVPNPPVSPHRSSFGKKVIPPSSWKAGGA